MQTDNEILGITEGAGQAEIRDAYRKIVKEIHPDVAREKDVLKNHLQFIRVNQAYGRLLKGSARKSRSIQTDKTTRYAEAAPVMTGIAGIVRHKDPAYAFYKTAMNCFMKIHPSQWNIDVKQILSNPHPGQKKELEMVQEKVRNLVKLFPRAYYYFSIVANEYPESVWCRDASEKMLLIEERTIRYRKIIESFTEHAKTVKRVNKMF
ncbi:MAG: hypothetical protein EHM28_12760 [Spirochaetaceae bacterium]|nr:MAG: hypothetical protein EHM28_12760 [Spirochaetaceae bacterium]